jgi:hypothetical protein
MAMARMNLFPGTSEQLLEAARHQVLITACRSLGSPTRGDK